MNQGSYFISSCSGWKMRLMNSMKKRGAPKKNGELAPWWMLERDTLVLCAYQKARKAGEKHLSAILEAVQFVREERPGMPISETEVKRILALWQPRDRPSAISVTHSDPKVCFYTLPNGWKLPISYTAARETRPVYPRANAKLSPDPIHKLKS
jgi:hypothetical protein